MGQSPGLLLTEAALGPQADRVRLCRGTPGARFQQDPGGFERH